MSSLNTVRRRHGDRFKRQVHSLVGSTVRQTGADVRAPAGADVRAPAWMGEGWRAGPDGEPLRVIVRGVVTLVILGLAIPAIVTHTSAEAALGAIGGVAGYWLR